jgi:uncharacterized protein YcfL
MFRNIFISLSLIGLCGCTHNPEISTAKQTTVITTAAHMTAEGKTNFGELINTSVATTPVKCYNWIPLDYTEEIKELNIHKDKK